MENSEINYKITSTNFSRCTGSRWSGISVYRDGILIARLKTDINNTRAYLRNHPRSRYWNELKTALTRARLSDQDIARIFINI